MTPRPPTSRTPAICRLTRALSVRRGPAHVCPPQLLSSATSMTSPCVGCPLRNSVCLSFRTQLVCPRRHASIAGHAYACPLHRHRTAPHQSAGVCRTGSSAQSTSSARCTRLSSAQALHSPLPRHGARVCPPLRRCTVHFLGKVHASVLRTGVCPLLRRCTDSCTVLFSDCRAHTDGPTLIASRSMGNGYGGGGRVRKYFC